MNFLKKIASKVWGGTKATGKFILRKGPVLASFAVGLQAVPALAGFAQWIPVILGITGAQPDTALSQSSGALVTQLILLVGSIRKFISDYKKFKVANP